MHKEINKCYFLLLFSFYRSSKTSTVSWRNGGFCPRIPKEIRLLAHTQDTALQSQELFHLNSSSALSINLLVSGAVIICKVWSFIKSHICGKILWVIPKACIKGMEWEMVEQGFHTDRSLCLEHLPTTSLHLPVDARFSRKMRTIRD